MSFKRIILVALLALTALGVGATALLLGGVGLACLGLARLALRRGRQPEISALPAPRTGRELQRVRPQTPDGEPDGPQVSVRRYHP
jgi:hypothetical protein